MTRPRSLLLALLVAATLPAPGAAQFPAELAGRVVEQGTSRPIAGAQVQAGTARTVTDATGAFSLRVPNAGDVVVTVSHPAYAELAVARRLESGRTAREVFALQAPLSIEGIAVIAPRRAGFVIDADDIEQSGAHTLAELLREVPGLVVRNAASGGARVSIRGSAPDQVLVVVDGVAVNDAVTGEADAGAVSLQGVRSVQVLPGAHSARYGARAAAGVIVVETGFTSEPFAAVAMRSGALGARALEVEAGARRGALGATGGLRYRAIDGEFDYDRPDALGGGTAPRLNADERDLGGFGSVALPLLGELRVRAELGHVERGLPGPMHAPTPEARQDVVRGDVRAAWSTVTPLASLHAIAGIGWHRLRYDDPAPPFGPAYHDTTRVRDATLRFEAERTNGDRLSRAIAIGVETRHVALESTSLEPRRVTRLDPALFARGSVELPAHALTPRLSVAARADRWEEDWILSHEVALAATASRVTAGLAQRSAFNPPAASDQFFAAGFAIAPNAALRPERVRSELEVTLTTAFELRRVSIAAGASAFRGDIDDVIVWAPDFRFVWSPRNRDVKRTGGEAWLRARPARDVELGAWGALTRVTYDWDGDADTVQIVYRPRYSGGVSAEWRPGSWSLGADALYTGLRYATPGHANPLPGYWDIRLAAGRRWERGPLRLDAALRVDRLLDNTDSFVHGYAEPGRRISLEVRVHAAEQSTDLAINRTGS